MDEVHGADEKGLDEQSECLRGKGDVAAGRIVLKKRREAKEPKAGGRSVGLPKATEEELNIVVNAARKLSSLLGIRNLDVTSGSGWATYYGKFAGGKREMRFGAECVGAHLTTPFSKYTDLVSRHMERFGWKDKYGFSGRHRLAMLVIHEVNHGFLEQVKRSNSWHLHGRFFVDSMHEIVDGYFDRVFRWVIPVATHFMIHGGK